MCLRNANHYRTEMERGCLAPYHAGDRVLGISPQAIHMHTAEHYMTRWSLSFLHKLSGKCTGMHLTEAWSTQRSVKALSPSEGRDETRYESEGHTWI